MVNLLIPGYLKWDGKKYVTDPNPIGPPGIPGQIGPQGLPGSSGVGQTFNSIGTVGGVGTLRGTPGTALNEIAALTGYFYPGDGGGGLFYWSTANLTDDDGTIFASAHVAGPPLGYWVRLFSGALNVRWFGAIGDSVDHKGNGSYDTTFIQSAFNYLLNNNGGTLEFGHNLTDGYPSPTYLITAYLTLEYVSNFQLDLQGAVIKMKGGSPFVTGTFRPMLFMYGCTFFTFKNGTFDGNNTEFPFPGLSDSTPNIYIQDYNTDFAFENFSSINAIQDGILFYNSVPSDATHAPMRGLIQNCYFNNIGRNGCSVVSGQYLTFHSCTFMDCTGNGSDGTGIDFEPNPGDAPDNVANCVVDSCHFENNNNWGVSIPSVSPGHGVIVTNCYFKTCGQGAIVSSAQDCKFTNNIFDSFTSAYFAVLNISNRSLGDHSRNIVTGNTFRDCTVACIYVGSDYNDNNIISNNNFYNCYTGINAYSQIIISDNNFHTMTSWSINLIYTAGIAPISSVVSNNVFQNGTTYQLIVEHLNSIISGNQFQNCSAVPTYGALLMTGPITGVTGCIVTGNNFVKTTSDSSIAMYLIDGCTNTSIHDNSFVGYSTTPIFITTSSDVASMSNNIGFGQGTATIDPGTITNGTSVSEGPITIAGAVLGDYVQVFPPYDTQGVIVYGWVSSSNTITLRLLNQTGSDVTLGSSTWIARIVR